MLILQQIYMLDSAATIYISSLWLLTAAVTSIMLWRQQLPELHIYHGSCQAHRTVPTNDDPQRKIPEAALVIQNLYTGILMAEMGIGLAHRAQR